MNNSQRRANEKYIINLMRLSRNWVWIDTGNIYKFVDGKVIPETLKGYADLKCIVRKEFMENYVIIPLINLNLKKN